MVCLQLRVRESHVLPGPHLVLAAQPSTQPPGRVSVHRCVRRTDLKKPYKEVGFVHIGGHGSKKGIGLIGGIVPWSKVSGKLCTLAPTLAENQKRVLCLSCCFSIHAYKKMKKNLKGHFTACYYFKRKGIEFADAMTVWSMFYLKIGLENPHQEIANDINQYLGSQTISFVKI